MFNKNYLYIPLLILILISFNKCNTANEPVSDPIDKPVVNPIKPVKPKEEIENFIYDDFHTAVTLSNKHNIKILIVFGADWCPYCEELKRDIKSTHIDSIIVCFIDTDNVANKRLVARFRPRSLPTSILFYKDKEKQRKIGYRKKEYLKWVNGLQ